MYDIAIFFDGNVNITRLDARLNPTTLPYYNFMCLHGCVILQIFPSFKSQLEFFVLYVYGAIIILYELHYALFLVDDFSYYTFEPTITIISVTHVPKHEADYRLSYQVTFSV